MARDELQVSFLLSIYLLEAGYLTGTWALPLLGFSWLVSESQGSFCLGDEITV